MPLGSAETVRALGRYSDTFGLEAVAPLVGAGAGFASGAAVLMAFDPTAGLGMLPLTGFLVPCAFLAFLAAGVAWRRSTRQDEGSARSEPDGEEPPERWSESARDVPDPDTAMGPPPWEESRLPAGRPPAIPPAPVAPRPPDEVEIALAEIARIEEELGARPAPPSRRSGVVARS